MEVLIIHYDHGSGKFVTEKVDAEPTTKGDKITLAKGWFYPIVDLNKPKLIEDGDNFRVRMVGNLSEDKLRRMTCAWMMGFAEARVKYYHSIYTTGRVGLGWTDVTLQEEE